jgi:hypothetical protein
MHADTLGCKSPGGLHAADESRSSKEHIALSPNEREESVMPFTKHRHTLQPAELKILQKVFDQLCMERRLGFKDKEQRELLAWELMGAFQNGVTDEAALLQSFSKCRKAAQVGA